MKPPRPEGNGSRGRRRIVIISPVVPNDRMPHAGGVYLQHLHRALTGLGAEVTFIVHDVGAERDALRQPGAPERVLFVGAPQTSSVRERAIMRAAREVEQRLWQMNPTWPPVSFIIGLMLSAEARAAIHTADLIDLQWPEYARLMPVLKRLNRRARLIATLHDVLSQRWARRAAGATGPEAARARRAEASARRLELATVNRADAVLVFSDKDRQLIVDAAGLKGVTIEVVAPPLSVDQPLPRRPSRTAPVVVFVSLLSREENEDAALWLVRRIWPHVREEVPEAWLRVVGSGASGRLIEAIEAGINVELTGFVDDLDAVYASAAVCVVPLRLGAGVKFKTVEALIAGVPTVTTSIGAEGIAGSEKFAGFADDAEGFASSVVRVLRKPEQAEQHASQAQSWARAGYDAGRFSAEVGRIYGITA